jgi:hypothetical protein
VAPLTMSDSLSPILTCNSESGSFQGTAFFDCSEVTAATGAGQYFTIFFKPGGPQCRKVLRPFSFGKQIDPQAGACRAEKRWKS